MKTLTTDKILHVFLIVTTYLSANHIGKNGKNHPFTIEEIFKACINVSKEEVSFLIKEMLAIGILQEICINNNFYYNFPENISISVERDCEINTLEIKLTKSKPVTITARKIVFTSISCDSTFLKYPILVSWTNNKERNEQRNLLRDRQEYTPINYINNKKSKINHDLKEDFPNGWFDFTDTDRVVKLAISENAPENYEANIFLKIKQ